MARGVDYSFARPSPSTLAADGYTTVGRYLASSSSKRLSGAEATSLHAAGLTIFLVFEDFANPLDNWGGTGISIAAAHAGGVADATQSVGQANALGVPASRPIYVALDFSQPVTNSNTLQRLASYMQGWSDTISVGRVGVYGGGPLWSSMVGSGVASSLWFWQAAAASWSNYQIPYPGAVILQGISGSPAGTDPDTTFVNDWGQWPAPSSVAPTPPPNPKPGGTNVANVNISTSGYAQLDDQTLITPDEVHDQIIYSVTTTDATLATGSHSAFYQIPNDLGQAGYPIGTFSFDGGQTFNDFGFELPVIPSSAGVYPGVTIQPIVTSNGTIQFDGVNNTGATVSLILNIALLASNSPGTLTSLPKVLSGNLSYSNIYPKLTNDITTRVYSTYRRIASAGSALGSSVTVAHNQGTIPNITFWVQASGSVTINPIGWQSTGSAGPLGIKMDSTNLYFHVDSGTYNNCFYRIYRDN